MPRQNMYEHEEAITRIKDENNRMLMRRGRYFMVQLAIEMEEANGRKLTPTARNKVMNQDGSVKSPACDDDAPVSGVWRYVLGHDVDGANMERGGIDWATGEYRGETKDPAIPVENVAIVKQFLKLKPPTFSGEMDPVKANEWLLEMEKNFRLLRCSEQQKVEIGSYLLTSAASRWWNLKGVRESSMNWARFKVIFREKYVPRALQNAKCAEFEQLKQTGKTITEYEAAFTNLAKYAPHLVATDEMRARRFEDGLRYEIKRVIRPLVLPTYADVLDRAIIVEQDKMEKRNYFDSKKRQNFNNEGPIGQKRQKPESNWRNQGKNQRGQIPTCSTCGKKHSGECWRNRPDVICFYCNEVGHIRRNCPKLGTGAIVPRGNQGGGNAKPGGNRQGDQGNRSGNGNNQRQGQAFALMPGDARNDEIVVAEMGPQSIVRINV
ncbi:hypothetical protein Acr_26g0000310 [Actinidia rufa]|uniref:CCHC-type domain-containing protein n=1 Tax=Actinidia rufa TaxID=165716 RepID=A0A7J0H1C0_9ERIC|nr:hypothetical protein Acr_26g0000310 [Actinidia rufa]